MAQCHQYDVRQRAASRPDADVLFPSPAAPALASVDVRPVSKRIASKVILTYEWLGTLPPCTFYFGAMFDGVYCGGVACVQTTTGAGPFVARNIGVPTGKLAYLVRGACVHWAPKGTAPKLINQVAKAMGREGFHAIIAYSDTDAGEIGTVYQAAGWDCLGYGVPHDEYVSPQGRVVNCRQVHHIREQLVREGWRRQSSNPKLRYIKVLAPGRDNEVLAGRINALRIAYPKRVSPVEGPRLPGEDRRGSSDPDAPPSNDQT